MVVSATAGIPTPIQNANNNYISGSALCGFVLDKDTDAELRAGLTQANNYNPQIATGGAALWGRLPGGERHRRA